MIKTKLNKQKQTKNTKKKKGRKHPTKQKYPNTKTNNKNKTGYVGIISFHFRCSGSSANVQ